METSAHAKTLRKSMTGAERKLWTHLRGRQLRGVKFRRQHQIGPYVVDFIAFESRLVIELDGGHHALQLAEDSKRGDWLTSNGFTVLRFWNHEVLQQTEAVLQTIAEGLAPHPNPPPRRGRGVKKGNRQHTTPVTTEKSCNHSGKHQEWAVFFASLSLVAEG
jgi:2-methylaconitate isomerase